LSTISQFSQFLTDLHYRRKLETNGYIVCPQTCKSTALLKLDHDFIYSCSLLYTVPQFDNIFVTHLLTHRLSSAEFRRLFLW